MSRRTIATVVFLSFGVGVAAAQLTLPDLAKLRGPKPVSRSRTRELVPPPFEEIVAKADLIVHGRAVATKTYLSDDQMHLYTDYLITPVRVLLQRTVMSTPVPGATPPPIIVRQFGGEMMIDGVTVSDQDDEQPPLQSGAEVLLILVYNKADGKYRLPEDIAGAFSVNGSQIAPLMRPPVKYERFSGMSLLQLTSEVSRLRPQR
jgi:hypothetical protein